MQIDKILRTAMEYNASDVYVTSGTKPTLRINGNILPIAEHAELTNETASAYINEMMNDEQKKKFAENWDIDFSIEIAGVARFRVNVFIQRKGIGAALRVIPSKIRSMEELKLPQALRKIPNLQNGLVLITGPTGAGKSTTLAAIVAEINSQQAKHIITIEDPIEFVHANNRSIIEQRELTTHTKDFKSALRAALREDTDVILVGEMRDLDTIELALTAAETGHLVLSTLHTSGAAKSIDRIIDVFPSGQQSQIRSMLAENLRMIVWQSLLTKRDNSGLLGAYEILVNNHAVANLIRTSKTFQIQSAMETGASEGMQTMKKCVMTMLEQGLITDEEAQANIPDETDLS
ncbi:MAG: type IV pilus twitching motility protein PilT [Patescibacteria group bacterium]